MKAAKILLVGLLFGQISTVAHAATVAPLTQYVRELRNDYSFGVWQGHDWDGDILTLQSKAANGDQKAAAAVAAVPAYVAYQAQLAGRTDLNDAEALKLFQLGYPILGASLPNDLSPLHQVEALSICLYTAKTYLAMNDDISRNWGEPKHFETYVASLDSALLKLPPYNGVVFHVQDMSAAELAKQRVGKRPLSFNYYLSTSTEKIGWQGNVRMIIHTKSGRLIDRYSINPQEHEVLIMRHVNLKVIKDPVLVNNMYEIEYEEVSN